MSFGSWLKKAAWWVVGGPMVGAAKMYWDYAHKRAPTPAARVPQFSSYGQALPFGYGKTRLTGNAVYYKAHYTGDYNALLIALCEGPIDGVTRVWRDQKVADVDWIDGSLTATPNPIAVKFGWNAAQLRTGSRPAQSAPPLVYDTEGVKVTYPGVAYMAIFAKASPETFVGYSYEAKLFLHGTGGTEGDAHAADVLRDFLTSATYACGVDDARVVTDTGQDGESSSSARQYITAEGFWISPLISEQREAREHLRELLESVNCDVVCSEGKFKILPYGDVAVTGNGGTYAPVTALRYALSNADYLDEEQPIQVDVEPDTDRWNIWPVEYLDRSPIPLWKPSTWHAVDQRVQKGDRVYRCATAGTSAASGGPTGTGSAITDGTVLWAYVDEFDKARAYNVAVEESAEPLDESTFGPRRAPAASLHAICLRSVAQKISQIRAQRSVYSRATYRFRLPFQFCRLEPMDLVSLTDEYLGISARVVRVTSIEEDADLNLTVTAEEWPFGICGTVEHVTESSEGSTVLTDAEALALEPAARDGSNIPENTIPGTVIADETISIDKLVVGALKTSNYAEDVSGNPTAGAKLDHQGTALKVAPGNFQIGSYFLAAARRVAAEGTVYCINANDINHSSVGPVSSVERYDRGAGVTPRYVVRVTLSESIPGVVLVTPREPALTSWTPVLPVHLNTTANFIDVGLRSEGSAWIDPNTAGWNFNYAKIAAW